MTFDPRLTSLMPNVTRIWKGHKMSPQLRERGPISTKTLTRQESQPQTAAIAVDSPALRKCSPSWTQPNVRANFLVNPILSPSSMILALSMRADMNRLLALPDFAGLSVNWTYPQFSSTTRPTTKRNRSSEDPVPMARKETASNATFHPILILIFPS